MSAKETSTPSNHPAASPAAGSINMDREEVALNAGIPAISPSFIQSDNKDIQHSVLQLQRSQLGPFVQRKEAEAVQISPDISSVIRRTIYHSEFGESGHPLPTFPAPVAADTLTTRIARCIGIWETNRGKNDPAPKESGLDTVAGVHASMATIEQATMPYAIDAMRAHDSLRKAATPPLTMQELNDASARCKAVTTLLTAVRGATVDADTFIKNNTASISAAWLVDADVRTMFKAVTLKSTIDTAHTDVQATAGAKEKKAKVQEEIDDIAADDRLGLGEGSLRAYINKPGNWGENVAGWQRKAVNNMAGNVGTRINAVATSDNGTALAIPVIQSRVDAQLSIKPVPSQDDIISTVAQQNNPNEANYGANVLATYKRLYP